MISSKNDLKQLSWPNLLSSCLKYKKQKILTDIFNWKIFC